jgi:Polycystin cation channel
MTDSNSLFVLKGSLGGENSTNDRRPPLAALDIVNCDELLSNIKRYQARERYFWTLPVAIVGFALCLSSFVAHSQVDSSYTTEAGILAVTGCNLDKPPSVYVFSDVYTYLSSTVLPAYLPLPNSSIAGFNTILGGVMVSQSRSVQTTCGAFPDLVVVDQSQSTNTTVACQPFGTESTSPFNVADPTSTYYDPSSPVFSAFSPYNLSSVGFPNNSPFSLFFPSYNDLPTSQSLVDALQAGNWLSQQTQVVTISFGTMGLNTNSWAQSFQSLTFTRGGRVAWDCSVKSSPIDLYLKPASNLGLDIATLVYLAYVWFGALVHCVKFARKSFFLLQLRGWAAINRMFLTGLAWFLIDIGTAVSLAVAFALWFNSRTALMNFRSFIVAFATIWSGQSTMTVLNQLNKAIASFYSFKNAGVVCTILLTLRLFHFISLQPKLGIIVEALSRGFSDIVHFFIPWALFTVGLGVWGRVAFGSQVSSFATNAAAAFGHIKFQMYDYQWDAMYTADPVNARIYYGILMFMITNLILWMFLVIPLDNFSYIRAEVEGEPNALDDIVSGAKLFPGKLKRLAHSMWNFVKQGCGCRGLLVRSSPFSGSQGASSHWRSERAVSTTRLFGISTYKVVHVLQTWQSRNNDPKTSSAITVAALAKLADASVDDMSLFVARFRPKHVSENERLFQAGAGAVFEAFNSSEGASSNIPEPLSEPIPAPIASSISASSSGGSPKVVLNPVHSRRGDL